MKQTGTRSLVQGALVIAALILVAVPLSNLMVGDTPAKTLDTLAVETTQVSDADGTSAVSSLMAGSAVGPTRGGRLMPRHPASAFVP